MALNPDVLKNYPYPALTRAWTWQQAALYALGLGYGLDPCDQAQLRHVAGPDIVTLPAMINVLAHENSWMRDPATGIEYSRIVHGSQEFELYEPLPAEGAVVSEGVLEELVDKGEKGAIVVVRREVRSAADSKPIGFVRMSVFCRGAGGFGGSSTSAIPAPPQPEGEADVCVTLQSPPNQALIYRLSGDLNPLHSDPQVAKAAGFPRPILHGLASFGMAGRAAAQALNLSGDEAIRAMSVRFSQPVYPGDEIAFRFWHGAGPGRVLFDARVEARGVQVLSVGSLRHV